MNLLIITQKIDLQDPILGFFHRWVFVLAKHYSSILVICLEKGEYNLPKNVRVLSLGKESGGSRLQYIYNFFRFIIFQHKNYEKVFVHMNQEYVLFGGVFWKLFRKRVYLWRNHPKGNFLTRVAVLFSHQVFCTSPQSFTARFKKTVLMPVGIDTEFFKPTGNIQKKHSILFFGRIAPIKRVEIFIDALSILQTKRINFEATISGVTLDSDVEYEKIILQKIQDYNLSDRITFRGAVKAQDAFNLYNEHEIYVNATKSGSLDKTQFEAMACGSMVLTCNQAFRGILTNDLVDLFVYKEGDSADLAKLLEQSFNISLEEREVLGNKLRQIVIEKHSLGVLLTRLTEALKT